MEILLFWLPGRVAGPEVGPGRKWQGLGPALSIASAATGQKQVTVGFIDLDSRINKLYQTDVGQF